MVSSHTPLSTLLVKLFKGDTKNEEESLGTMLNHSSVACRVQDNNTKPSDFVSIIIQEIESSMITEIRRFKEVQPKSVWIAEDGRKMVDGSSKGKNNGYMDSLVLQLEVPYYSDGKCSEECESIFKVEYYVKNNDLPNLVIFINLDSSICKEDTRYLPYEKKAAWAVDIESFREVFELEEGDQ